MKKGRDLTKWQKPLTPKDNSKKQCANTKKKHQNFIYKTIADRL